MGPSVLSLEGPFNDIVNWRYTHLPEMLGAGCAFSVQNEGEFDTGNRKTHLIETQHFVLIEADLEKSDMSR